MKGTDMLIKALGEIVIRVNDLDVMQEFYWNVLGLELLNRFDKMVFFKIAPSYGGHTQVLALFDVSIPSNHVSRHHSALNVTSSTLHHIAFTIALSDYEAEKERLQQLGLEVETQEHSWVHWKSLYVTDPEGNVVELVCYDVNVL